MDITDLLLFAQKNNASDLHLSTGNPPIIRAHGEMMPYSSPPVSAMQVKDMLYSVMSEHQRSEFERELEIDFAIEFGDTHRFRVNAFNMINGPAAVFRAIPSHIPSLEELNSPAIFKRLAELHKGLVLVTGPTGSGKSTTLAAMINHINTHYGKHILTIEDPVEFVHKSKKSLINQREVGKSTNSFARALRSSLREDPDVILVGELRDLETIQLAITAAETGHVVFGTLHTNSAPETIDRIIDVFPPESKEMVRAMLSTALQGVITQSLLKKKGGGRVAAFEVMLATPAIRNLIREGRIPQIYSMIQIGSKLGMTTMKDSVNSLLVNGLIDEATAKEALMSSMKEELKEEEEPDKKKGKAAPAPTAAPIQPSSASGNF